MYIAQAVSCPCTNAERTSLISSGARCTQGPRFPPFCSVTTKEILRRCHTPCDRLLQHVQEAFFTETPPLQPRPGQLQHILCHMANQPVPERRPQAQLPNPCAHCCPLVLRPILAMPKSRYSAVFDLGEEAQDVAYRTCSVQVNLDFSSEEDMVRKFRASLALQPVATALFANSPFTEGKPNGYSTFRSHLWDAWDSSRTSNLPQVFDHDFGFQKYVEFALDVPMFLVSRGGQDVECVGGTFRQFLEGKLEQLPGQFPTIQDWESHLTTIYTEVRLKKFLEMRGADVGLLPMLCALPALWVGLLYDEEALQGALESALPRHSGGRHCQTHDLRFRSGAVTRCSARCLCFQR